MVGGAVAAVLAGMFGVHDVAMHGGPIVGVLGACKPAWVLYGDPHWRFGDGFHVPGPQENYCPQEGSRLSPRESPESEL